MFQYDSTTVCKVLDQNELDFYQSMPEDLKNFTPEFRGKRKETFRIESLDFYRSNCFA